MVQGTQHYIMATLSICFCFVLFSFVVCVHVLVCVDEEIHQPTSTDCRSSYRRREAARGVGSLALKVLEGAGTFTSVTDTQSHSCIPLHTWHEYPYIYSPLLRAALHSPHCMHTPLRREHERTP